MLEDGEDLPPLTTAIQARKQLDKDRKVPDKSDYIVTFVIIPKPRKQVVFYFPRLARKDGRRKTEYGKGKGDGEEKEKKKKKRRR